MAGSMEGLLNEVELLPKTKKRPVAAILGALVADAACKSLT